MIESIRIVNFKSLAAITLRLKRFNCLVGMNGAGKSTVLQALDFLSQLMRGDVQGWLDQRGWSAADLHCKLVKERNIWFTVKFKPATGGVLNWVGVFNRTDLQCFQEDVFFNDGINTKKLLRSKGQIFELEGKPRQNISFEFQGSILSVLKDTELSAPLLEFRNALRQIRSLELLSPHLLRKSARVSENDIGAGGEKLSAYLDNIKGDKKAIFVELLQKFYPALVDFKITSQRSGWKKLSVFEQFGDQKLETEALHLNDGLLRILAILAQTNADRSMLLLDEIENGINQEIAEVLVEALLESPQQLLVTTHSPLLLNYLPDDVALEAVQFVYKKPNGKTEVCRFFDIPRIAEKLQVMGPGDAFVDTDLKLLTQECIELDQKAEDAIKAAEQAESEAIEQSKL